MMGSIMMAMDMWYDVYGYDFGDQDSDVQDEHGHGTHVVSVLARTAPGVRVIPVKINPNGQSSFTSASVAEAIYFAVNRGANIINMSLTLAEYSQAVAQAVEYAISSGVFVVAAAGNNSDTVQFPALLDNVVAVGSLHYFLERAWFSPTGPEIEITAPGVLIDVTELGEGPSANPELP